jgi:hypothetical protein
MISLKMEYCKSCGDCCFVDCKGSDGLCHMNPRYDVCDSFPIMNTGMDYFLGICKGINENKIPRKAIEDIILRLNNGENNFEVKSQGLDFLITPDEISNDF